MYKRETYEQANSVVAPFWKKIIADLAEKRNSWITSRNVVEV